MISDRLKAHLAMVLFAALIAGSFSFGRLALPFLEPLPLNALRFIFGTIILGVATFVVQRQRFFVPTALWRFLILGAFMGFYFVSMFIALAFTAPVSISAVFTLTPLVTVIVAFVLVGQRLSPIVLVSLAFAAIGSIWVIFRGDITALAAFDVGQGEVIYFAGCVGHALFTALLRRFNRGEPLMVLTFYNVGFTAFWITLFALPQLMATDFAALPPMVWLVLAYLAFGSTAITYFILQYAAEHLPAAKVMAYGYLVPTVVILYEVALGNGWASGPVALGALITVMGLIVLYITPDERKSGAQ